MARRRNGAEIHRRTVAELLCMAMEWNRNAKRRKGKE